MKEVGTRSPILTSRECGSQGEYARGGEKTKDRVDETNGRTARPTAALGKEYGARTISTQKRTMASGRARGVSMNRVETGIHLSKKGIARRKLCKAGMISEEKDCLGVLK